MRIRVSGLASTAIVALLIAACAGPAATTRPQATGTASTATSAPQTDAPATDAPASDAPATDAPATDAPASDAPGTGAPSTAEPASPPAGGTPGAGEFNVAVVTDVGTVNDKNFNEYSYLGAVNGSVAINAPEPPVFVPPDSSQYQAGIDAFIEQGYNIIVTVGFALEAATTVAAKANPDIWFVGVDQNPCIDAEGVADPTFTCAGDVATAIPNYVLLQFQEDQAGYLVGIVAGSISEAGVIGAIGGITLCGPCVRYIQGYELGAQSVNPDITVETAYVTESDFVLAFNDPVAGKDYGQTFIEQTGVDVVFQVAGKTGNGVLDAVCEAGIHGIGVDVDQALSYPDAAECIVTSAEKKLALAVENAVVAISDGTVTAGRNLYNAANDGIGVSDFHDNADLLTPDIQAALDEAIQGMKDGTLVTCPEEGCGVYTP